MKNIFNLIVGAGVVLPGDNGMGNIRINELARCFILETIKTFRDDT